MDGWAELAAALSAFLLSHVVPTRPAIKARLKSALGAAGFGVAYSLISVALLGWIIVAAGRASYLRLWDFEPWEMRVPNLLVPIACLAVAFGLAAPNPLSFGGWAVERFNPDRPGISGVSRHPLLLGLTLWAVGHLVPNGDVAHVVLFGAFALFSIGGMVALDVRLQRTMGRRTWDVLAARTSLIPLAALLDGRWQPSIRRASLTRLGIAVLVWATLLSMHSLVIGISPLPLP